MSDPQSRNEALIEAIINETTYTDPPQSRNEAILKSILDETEYTEAPQSRMEDLLIQLKEYIEEGGGGGGGGVFTQLDTTSYTKAYNDERFGMNGRLENVLAYKDFATCFENMNEGWSSSKGATYDIENSIGAYAGYTFDKRYIEQAWFYLGKYSGQNATLYIDLETLDEGGTWTKIDTVEISPTASTGYPINLIAKPIREEICGIRWIHQTPPNKTNGNTVTFFGLCLWGFEKEN